MGKKNRIKFRDSRSHEATLKENVTTRLAKNIRILNKAPMELFLFLGVFSIPMAFWNNFYTDWTNHIWLISHFRTELLGGNLLPDFIHVEGAKFESMPFYYGTFFYPLAAIISVPLGANLTIKIAIVALVALLFLKTYNLFISTGNTHKYSAGIAILFSTSIYSATNLYNRSALTEFFSNIFISIGLIYVFTSFAHANRVNTFKSNIALGLFFITLGLGTHPIITFTSAIFIFPAVAFFIAARWNTLEKAAKKNLLIGSGSVFLLLAPIYALIIKYRQDFPIGNGNALETFPNSIDSLWARIGIFYIDSRAFEQPIHEIGTPFLNAPLGLPIVFMFVFLTAAFLKQKNKKLLEQSSIVLIYLSTLVLLACLIGLPMLSTENQGPLADLSKFLAPIQFLYRLSGTLHLLMMVGIVIVSLSGNSENRKSDSMVGLTTLGARALSAIALLLLSFHICLTFFEYSKINGFGDTIGAKTHRSMVSNSSQFPQTFYGMRQFNMESGLSEIVIGNKETTTIQVKPDGKTFFRCDSDQCTLKTDVYPTKLISVGLDGIFPKQQSLLERNVSFNSSPGTHYISVRIQENLIYAIRMAFYCLVFWLLFIIFREIVVRLNSQRALGLSRTRRLDPIGGGRNSSKKQDAAKIFPAKPGSPRG